MLRKDTRSLTINGHTWEYKIGKNTVAIYEPDGKTRHFPKFTDIVGEKDVSSGNYQLNPAVIQNYIYTQIVPNKQLHKCISCNRRKPDVALVQNPFAAEINEDYSLHYLCNSCCADLRDEI